MLSNTPGAVTVKHKKDFEYKVNHTIEREYWLKVSDNALPSKQGLAGTDGYVIMHVHYAGNWDAGDLWKQRKRKRSTITQVNIRHTWHIGRPEKEKFVMKCEALNRWPERTGTPILEAPDGWLWREHDHPNQDIGNLCVKSPTTGKQAGKQAYNVCACVRVRVRVCLRVYVCLCHGE